MPPSSQQSLVLAQTPEQKGREYATRILEHIEKNGKPELPVGGFEAMIRTGCNDISVWPIVHGILKADLHPGTPALPANEAEGRKRERRAIPRGAFAHLTEKKLWKADGREFSWAKDFVEKVPNLDLDIVQPEISEIEEAKQLIADLPHLTAAEKASYTRSLQDGTRMEGVMQGRTASMLMLVEKVRDAAEKHNSAVGTAKSNAEWEIAEREGRLKDERIAMMQERLAAEKITRENAEVMTNRVMKMMEVMVDKGIISRPETDMGEVRGTA